MTLTLSPARLGDVLDLEQLTARIADGHLDVRHHRDGDLALLDYTRRTQTEAAWDPVTLTCRGLIVTTRDGRVDADSVIVARGLPKFFTLEQHAALAAAGVLDPLPQGEPVQVFTKEDGSLGLAYLAPDGRPAIATRGSFHSAQAHWATAHLRARPELEAATAALLTRGTPCLEIISPVSRVVKEYDFADLVLLTVIDRATGADVDAAGVWPGRVAARHEGLGDYRGLAALNWPEEEGFVVRFASGARVKCKFADYLRRHKLVTGTSTTHVWEHLAVADLRRAGYPARDAARRLGIDARLAAVLYERGAADPVEDLLEGVPREFGAWVTGQVAALRAGYAARAAFYAELFAGLPAGLGRKELAALITGEHKAHAGALFRLADRASIAHIIWSEIRPPHATAWGMADLDG